MSYKTYEVTVYDNGDKIWFLKGKPHREDGPAYEYSDGTKEWFLNGKPHREDGPACEYADGSKEWYLNGQCFTEEQWRKKLNKTHSCEGEMVVIRGQKYKLEAVYE